MRIVVLVLKARQQRLERSPDIRDPSQVDRRAAHAEPLDLALSTDRACWAVQAIADDRVDPFSSGDCEPFRHLIGNRFHVLLRLVGLSWHWAATEARERISGPEPCTSCLTPILSISRGAMYWTGVMRNTSVVSHAKPRCRSEATP